MVPQNVAELSAGLCRWLETVKSDVSGVAVGQIEHERRFLVSEPEILAEHEGFEISQAYLWKGAGGALRVRWTRGRDQDGSIYDGPFLMTFKGPKSSEGSRVEIETEYDEHAVRFMLANAEHVVTKHRYLIVSEGNNFEVDVFSGDNEGLVIAEFEASKEAVAKLKKPWWCGREVTADDRYNNENLATNPWRTWPENLTPSG